MRVRSHDQGFVPRPPAEVYRAVADLGGYPRWWPGAAPNGSGVTIRLGRRAVSAAGERHRDATGLFLALPELDGTLEWYLEPFEEDGTIVNLLLDVELPRQRRLLRMRMDIRSALVGLKRVLGDRG